jgi:hypothetical protein
MPAEWHLIAFAMRGNRPPPDPLTLTPDRIAFEIAWRSKATAERRWMRPDLGGIVEGVVQHACVVRGGRCMEVVVGRTCVYATVHVPAMSVPGLLDAVRLLVTKRARHKLGWPKTERVFAPRSRSWCLGGDQPVVGLAQQFPELDAI